MRDQNDTRERYVMRFLHGEPGLYFPVPTRELADAVEREGLFAMVSGPWAPEEARAECLRLHKIDTNKDA